MRIVLLGALFGLLASQSPAAVRAVIPECCVSSGNLSVLNPSTGVIERTFATGTSTTGSPKRVPICNRQWRQERGGRQHHHILCRPVRVCAEHCRPGYRGSLPAFGPAGASNPS
jgi:hypothetical protein